MHRRLTFSLVLGTAALAACSQDTPSAPSDLITPSFAIQAGPQAGDLIPDQYIVVFKDNITDSPGHARRLAAQYGTTVQHAYGRALKGFAGRMSAAAAGRLRGDPTVAYVEQDQVMTADAIQTQTGATWGLDRIDQRETPLSTTYDYTSMGAGVTAYIIDTGILLLHNDFGGRATSGFDAVDGGTADDCNGHGTHVAGTVGGTIYGVAKRVNLVAVRVLNCSGSGTNSGVIAGIEWVTSNHTAAAVANMSLGGGFSSALNTAVTNSIAGGVTYAVAAGNSNASACNYSPASTPTALTVGATTSSDAEASYSNYGSCVDIMAPGSSITSAWLGGGTNTISGTSMASPHVAGAAARYLSSAAGAGASPGTVATFLVGQATPNTITLKASGRGKKGGATGTPNKLLHMAPTG